MVSSMLKKPNPKAVITPCAKPYVNEDGTVEEATENEFELQEKILNYYNGQWHIMVFIPKKQPKAQKHW